MPIDGSHGAGPQSPSKRVVLLTFVRILLGH
jgi:hypothetical protein